MNRLPRWMRPPGRVWAGWCANLRQEAGLTTVIVTHAIEEAARLGERILVLGQPPNRSPLIVENPGAAAEGYSQSERVSLPVHPAARHAGAGDMNAQKSRPGGSWASG